MFRTVALSTSRNFTSRSFVSSALLTRAWRDETVAQLRKEAKSRGLSSTGTKPVLVARLEEFEKSQAHIIEPPKSRPMSTHAAFKTSEAPGNPEITKPSNSAAAFTVKIPNTNIPPPDPVTQIPYVPDFWHSSLPKSPEAGTEEAIPQILVVAGSETHFSGGPVHNHRDASNNTMNVEQDSGALPKPSGGLFDDMADDIGLPRPEQIKSSFWKVFS